MQDVKRLRVWELALQLTDAVIDQLQPARSRRVPGLRSQAIRAVTSVGANLAEGCARSSRGEFLHFVEIAIGSLGELEFHLLVARNARIIPVDCHVRLDRQLNTLRRMLIALTRTLQRRIAEDESIRRDQSASRHGSASPIDSQRR